MSGMEDIGGVRGSHPITPNEQDRGQEGRTGERRPHDHRFTIPDDDRATAGRGG